MTSTNEKYEEIKEIADVLFADGADWITFYREVLGLHGIMRRHCPTFDDLAQFKETEAYQQIQLMLSHLRRKDRPMDDPKKQGQEPTRVITVRIPKSLHEALRNEAFECHTSMNKLCISKLLQLIDNEMVPAEM